MGETTGPGSDGISPGSAVSGSDPASGSAGAPAGSLWSSVHPEENSREKTHSRIMNILIMIYSLGGRGVRVAVGLRVSVRLGVGERKRVLVIVGVKVGVFVGVGVMVGEETGVGV